MPCSHLTFCVMYVLLVIKCPVPGYIQVFTESIVLQVSVDPLDFQQSFVLFSVYEMK